MGGGPTGARSEPAMKSILHAECQWSRVAGAKGWQHIILLCLSRRTARKFEDDDEDEHDRAPGLWTLDLGLWTLQTIQRTLHPGPPCLSTRI